MPSISDADRDRLDAITVVLKMYGLHYKATIAEGARRPFRLVWIGTRESTKENSFQLRSQELYAMSYRDFTTPHTPHYFETVALLDDFVHKRLRKLGLQGV